MVAAEDVLRLQGQREITQTLVYTVQGSLEFPHPPHPKAASLSPGPEGRAPRAVSHWETVKEDIGSLIISYLFIHIYSYLMYCVHTHMNTYTCYDAHIAVRRQLVEASSLMRVLEINLAARSFTPSHFASS